MYVTRRNRQTIFFIKQASKQTLLLQTKPFVLKSTPTYSANMEEGERSIIEVKHLLHKLNPRGPGGHKDRVRVLSRFRNYVSGVNANKKGQKV